ncbi:MAG: hypothetical protein AAFN41_10065 [Planctomycetota bacterium]
MTSTARFLVPALVILAAPLSMGQARITSVPIAEGFTSAALLSTSHHGSDLYTGRWFAPGGVTQSFLLSPTRGLIDLPSDVPGDVRIFDISRDARTLVGTVNGTPYRWVDGGPGQPIPLPDNTRLEGGIRVAPDGEIAFGLADLNLPTTDSDDEGVVSIWNPGTGQHREIFRRGDWIIRSTMAPFSPNGRFLGGLLGDSVAYRAYVFDRDLDTDARQLSNAPGSSQFQGITHINSSSQATGESRNLTRGTAWVWDGADGYTRPDTVVNASASLGWISEDGSMIAGSQTVNCVRSATFWIDGVRIDAADYFESTYGLDLDGWTLTSVSEGSANGLSYFGLGVDPDGRSTSWIVTVPGPASATSLALFIAVAARRSRRLDPIL